MHGNQHREVLHAIERTVLTPDAIEYVIGRACEPIVERRHERPDALARLQAEVKREERRMANFMRLIGSGDAPQSALTEIRRLEASIAEKRAETDRFAADAPSELDVRRLKRAAAKRMGRFKDLIYADVPLARQASGSS